ncbi:hypothetical protein BC828DRAFT_95033 [Blastocladiella britannica]|nr:hypothetical protein BC828DRAFT_95033 [Blastocladiella britannica]
MDELVGTRRRIGAGQGCLRQMHKLHSFLFWEMRVASNQNSTIIQEMMHGRRAAAPLVAYSTDSEGEEDASDLPAPVHAPSNAVSSSPIAARILTNDDDVPVGPALPPVPTPPNPLPGPAWIKAASTSWRAGPPVTNAADSVAYADLVRRAFGRRGPTPDPVVLPPAPLLPQHSAAPIASAAFVPSSSAMYLPPIPPLPTAAATPATAALATKLARWRVLKATNGVHFTDAVVQAREAGCPTLFRDLAAVLGVDEYATALDRWDAAVGDMQAQSSPILDLLSMRSNFVDKRNSSLTFMTTAKTQTEATARATQRRQHELASRSRIVFVPPGSGRS